MKIILFTGLSASGKSAIAKQTAERLNLPLVEFHQLMHQEAKNRGFTRIRDWMKEIGGFEAALEQTRSTLFNKIQTLRNEKGVVIDQLIDMTTLNSLREVFQGDVPYVIFIRSNRHERRHWARKRDPENGVRDLILKDNLKLEVGLRNVVESADCMVANIGSLENITANLVDYLNIKLFGETSRRNSERNT